MSNNDSNENSVIDQEIETYTSSAGEAKSDTGLAQSPSDISEQFAGLTVENKKLDLDHVRVEGARGTKRGRRPETPPPSARQGSNRELDATVSNRLKAARERLVRGLFKPIKGKKKQKTGLSENLGQPKIW